jgi:hypothetical protein
VLSANLSYDKASSSTSHNNVLLQSVQSQVDIFLKYVQFLSWKRVVVCRCKCVAVLYHYHFYCCFCFCCCGLKSCTSLLENVSSHVPPSSLRDFCCLVFVPLINSVLLLGAPVVPTCWVKILTYLQSQPFFSITFILIDLKLLITFVHNPNVLWYVVLSYHVLVTCLHLCLFTFSVLMCFFLQCLPVICL